MESSRSSKKSIASRHWSLVYLISHRYRQISGADQSQAATGHWSISSTLIDREHPTNFVDDHSAPIFHPNFCLVCIFLVQSTYARTIRVFHGVRRYFLTITVIFNIVRLLVFRFTSPPRSFILRRDSNYFELLILKNVVYKYGQRRRRVRIIWWSKRCLPVLPETTYNLIYNVIYYL